MGTPKIHVTDRISPLEEAKRFIKDCMMAVGAPQENANVLADNLITADYRGFYTHGMSRLENYLKDIQDGVCDVKATPTIDKETAATALVDGHNGFGAITGKFCMELAIKKAKEIGIGIVAAHSSNHFGIASIYVLQAIEQKMIGFSFTNSSPVMVPTRAKTAAIGTNPISMGAPALNEDCFVLDMASTAVALGKIEMASVKGIPIPEGWALNDDGLVETDANIALKAQKLLPLGGNEPNGGYKGYGLGMMVDILCGILSGSNYGPKIRNWGKEQRENVNLGHCFIAIDPKKFADGFEDRLSDFMDYIRNLTPNYEKKMCGENSQCRQGLKVIWVTILIIGVLCLNARPQV